jgi:hypothetical protein
VAVGVPGVGVGAAVDAGVGAGVEAPAGVESGFPAVTGAVPPLDSANPIAAPARNTPTTDAARSRPSIWNMPASGRSSE